MKSYLRWAGNIVCMDDGRLPRQLFYGEMREGKIAFLKFTRCDKQALVECIPIAAVAVHLKLKSLKLVSHLIVIRQWIFKSLRQF